MYFTTKKKQVIQLIAPPEKFHMVEHGLTFALTTPGIKPGSHWWEANSLFIVLVLSVKHLKRTYDIQIRCYTTGLINNLLCFDKSARKIHWRLISSW